MYYSSFGLLALILHLIINYKSMISTPENIHSVAIVKYRMFLYAMIVYYTSDIFWGILYERRITMLVYADTMIFFASMVLSVLLWTMFVVTYLEQDNYFGIFLKDAGWGIFCFEMLCLIVNFFVPVVFGFDSKGTYLPGVARYLTLGVQVFLYMLTCIYALFAALKTSGNNRLRHLMLFFSGGIMTLFIILQTKEPLLPFYAVGCLIATCFVHIFIVEDERLAYASKLVIAKQTQKELEQRVELQDQLVEQSQVLSDALSQAEEANAAKTSFLSSMSHEIRTPMNAIIGFDSIALKDPNISDSTRDYLEKIDASARHLLSLINDILDMSRIESGRMTIRYEEFSFREMFDQINTMILGQCQEKGLIYESKKSSNVADYYIGDDMKLKQVIINILGNAVKYTPSPGKVTFTVEQKAKYDGNATLRFIIKDTGIGMNEDFLPKIFTPFSQEDDVRASSFGSTGLGMAISKNIIEMMNGRIYVKSKKGEGSEFTVIVTLKTTERIDEDSLEELYPQDLRVLVIDDNEVDCVQVKGVLKEIGIRCDICNSEEEAYEQIALAKARANNYDLILVDRIMPEHNGVEVTRHIRKELEVNSTVFLLTAYKWEDIESEAREAGIDDFLAKPLNVDETIDKLKYAMRSKKRVVPEKKDIDLTGKRILLAEDMLINAEIMKKLLDVHNMQVDHAENGKVCVDMFCDSEVNEYDAILMDIRMPVLDGLQATEAIRALDREDAGTIPIIAMTANAFDEDVQRSMQAGIDAHLTKPVETARLLDTLKELIGNRQDGTN